ncbi:MAG: hypothetical protein M0Z50_19655 [Planctomycetia bacterium]|nr:hypothetical protein [Planctomycetia bacterium]
MKFKNSYQLPQDVAVLQRRYPAGGTTVVMNIGMVMWEASTCIAMWWSTPYPVATSVILNGYNFHAVSHEKGPIS